MMKSETAVHRRPPTPPSVHPELHNAYHQIAQYDEDRTYSLNDSHRHGSAYGSPGPSLHDLSHHAPQLYPNAHGDSQAIDSGLGISFDRYSHDSGYYPEHSFHGMPHNQSFVVSEPPLTPSSGIEEESERRRSSGRPIVSPSPPQPASKPRPKPSPRTKKTKASKGEKPKMPKLTMPLSILTKDMTHIPVRNMEEWVNRSAEVRRKEVEKRNGYVTRPMNSFMLYRSAYAERTKQWCLQNNHQVVSSVSGESWPKEPAEVRELYNEYAKIERINHQNAHPTYKFSPSKAAAQPRKRKGEYSEDEPSDLEDAEWAPGHSRSSSGARTRQRMDMSVGYPANVMNTEFFERSFGSNGNASHRSSWDMSNPGRPMPMPMHTDIYGQLQYYAGNMHPNMSMGPAGMEDPQMRRLDEPIQFTSGAMLGLPGGNASDMMQHLHSHLTTPLADEGQVDPMLLAFDGARHQELGHGLMPQPEYQSGHLRMPDRELDQESVHSLLGTELSNGDYHSEHWQQDPTMAQMEHGSEFEQWMDEGHAS